MTPEGRKRDYNQAPLGVFLTTDTTETATTEARSELIFLIVVPAKFIDAAEKSRTAACLSSRDTCSAIRKNAVCRGSRVDDFAAKSSWPDKNLPGSEAKRITKSAPAVIAVITAFAVNLGVPDLDR